MKTLGAWHPAGCDCDRHTAPLPDMDNGYRVVGRCINCGDPLTLRTDYRDEPRLVHTSNLEPKCPIWYYAEADRPVPELGLFDPHGKP